MIGKTIKLLGQDPTKKYTARYRIVDIADLTASHRLTGAVNPDYPRELQPRDRARAASIVQIDQIARNLEPDALLTETYTLDRGAPIIGADFTVESGNARVLALRKARRDYPEQYHAYRAALLAKARELAHIDGEKIRLTYPVLVRERVSHVNRVQFCKEANQSAVLTMSSSENAQSDADLISLDLLADLEVSENQSLEHALKLKRNIPFVNKALARLSENDRAALLDAQGNLNQAGVKRIMAALFAKVFEDDQLIAKIYESTDNNIRNISNALGYALADLANCERLCRNGHRAAHLAIANDLAIAARKIAELHAQGIKVENYLKQAQLWQRELTSIQEQLLKFFEDNKRSYKRIGNALKGYARLVEATPDPHQGSFLGENPIPTKEELITRWLNPPSLFDFSEITGQLGQLAPRPRLAF